MSLRLMASLGAVITFLCLVGLMLWQIELAPARLLITFGAVFGIALLAAAVARMGSHEQ